MSEAVLIQPVVEVSPVRKARLAGLFWLFTIIAGIGSMVAHSGLMVTGNAAASAQNILANQTRFYAGVAAHVLSTCCYLAVTVLIYELFKPVNPTRARLGAFFSVVGCAIGGVTGFLFQAPLSILKQGQPDALAVTFYKLAAQANNLGLIFFAFHCFFTGLLILESRYAPKAIGALMVFAGIGWFSFVWPPLSSQLFPYNILPGFIGEASLTVWLLVKGVREVRS
jgi:Domain of unknown function (DUF4386)